MLFAYAVLKIRLRSRARKRLNRDTQQASLSAPVQDDGVVVTYFLHSSMKTCDTKCDRKKYVTYR